MKVKILILMIVVSSVLLGCGSKEEDATSTPAPGAEAGSQPAGATPSAE